MGHLPKLIEDLALLLMAGALTTIIFRRIRQPLVLGYILAGFLVGPHLSITPTVVDIQNVEILAEIGVIFLLFSLGLEFSFKKLMRVGGSASLTALVEIVFILFAGYYAGQWMGWSTMDSLFLGGMLASSSTTIIIRAFDELGVKTRQFARIVFGVLVVEDIVVILLMVLLSTMAVSQQFEGWELLATVFRLFFFLALWFILGIFLLPTFLGKVKNWMDEETTLILSIGLCLGMVVLATTAGFSAELGAFIMGSILAETTMAEKVEQVIKPVKDLFGAVFFVSVGMLIDPVAIMEYKGEVLLVTLLTLFGKMASTSFGALLSGQPLKQSVQIGMSMAQIGEFAFIVATLGLSLGVISDFLFPIAVGASAITTFTTPYLVKYSDRVYRGLERVLPRRWQQFIQQYSSSTQHIRSESNWKGVAKAYARILGTNGIVLATLTLISLNFIVPFLDIQFDDYWLSRTLALVVSLALGLPFLWAFMAKRPEGAAYRELWLDKKYSRGPLLVLEVSRYLLGIILFGFWVDRLFSATMAILVAVPVTLTILYFFSRRIQQYYQRIEGRFLTNLRAREILIEEQRQGPGAWLVKATGDLQARLAPWSAYIVDMVVGQHAAYAGMTLMELQWRERFGVNIAYIKRGERLIHAPGRNSRVLPYDHLGVIGTEDQLSRFNLSFEAKASHQESKTVDDVVLENLLIEDYSAYSGLSIRDSGIRERTHGLVVGIERGHRRLLNPESTMILEAGDIVWIVGDRHRIHRMRTTRGKGEGV